MAEVRKHKAIVFSNLPQSGGKTMQNGDAVTFSGLFAEFERGCSRNGLEGFVEVRQVVKAAFKGDRPDFCQLVWHLELS